MTAIDEIKSRIDIVELVSEAGVKLRHAGKNYTGFCPFHDNKKTPAFVVWPETGTWRCFGQCNEGGDIFKFVMKREGIDFKEALQKLGTRAGVEVTEYQRESPEQREAYDHLHKLLEDAVIYYRSHLFNNKDVLTYLREKRGLKDATIETFGLGYAPAGYDNLLRHFSAKGYSEQDLVDAGMLSVRESEDSRNPSRTYDRFRNRIMIPIRDENGRMVGFGARIVDPNDIPKFLNSPETPIFNKGHILYGLDRARKPIRAANQAVIVEGYLDVIALHQAGYENVVSPMGTALTEDQLRLLKRLTRRIVLALDPDIAGQKAILRGFDTARVSMDKVGADQVNAFNVIPNLPADQIGQFKFNVSAIVKFESRLQADIRIAKLPDDLDPDEIVERDKLEWSKIINDAKPIVTHVMETVAEGKDLSDAKVKQQIINEVLPIIEDIPDIVERDLYRQALARMVRVHESVLMSVQAKGPVVRRRPRGAESSQRAESPAVAAVNPRLKVESYCLSILLRKPDMLYRLDRKLEEFGLSPLAAEDFEYTDHQLLFGVLRLAVEQDEKDNQNFLAAHLPESLTPLVKDLLGPVEKQDPVDDRLLEDLLTRFLDLRRTHALVNVNQLRFMQEDEQQQGGVNLRAYQEQAMQFTRLLRNLDQAKHKISKRQT